MYKKDDFIEFWVFFFVFTHIISLVYLYMFWESFGVSVINYIKIQDLVFSAGNPVVSFALLFVVWLLIINTFELEKMKPIIAIFWSVILSALSMIFFNIYLFHYSLDAVFVAFGLTTFFSVHFTSVGLRPLFGSKLGDVDLNTAYPYIFLVVGGLFFSIGIATYDSKVIASKNVDDLMTTISVNGQEQCDYRLVSSLGDYYFVVPELVNGSTNIGDIDILFAIPANNVEKIIHNRGSVQFKKKPFC